MLKILNTKHNPNDNFSGSYTGNEMDDLYAIIRTFDSYNFELTGLFSAQFNNTQMVTDSAWNQHPTKDINTVNVSQIEND